MNIMLETLSLWLSPVQARVLKLKYGLDVVEKLKASGIRAELCRGEHLPKLIRNAERQNIPLMAVVGLREVETRSATVRSGLIWELGL
ncbi:hypothetical protein LIER_35822 [Lithospermum erythrorhizon]|uniref:Anticodon-binding domain-containing protein n=1 Tax=Lithospermum erythrorhizon TaxID=34254 RepID=A0AAV3NWQ4_LITER